MTPGQKWLPGWPRFAGTLSRGERPYRSPGRGSSRGPSTDRVPTEYRERVCMTRQQSNHRRAVSLDHVANQWDRPARLRTAASRWPVGRRHRTRPAGEPASGVPALACLKRMFPPLNRRAGARLRRGTRRVSHTMPRAWPPSRPCSIRSGARPCGPMPTRGRARREGRGEPSETRLNQRAPTVVNPSGCQGSCSASPGVLACADRNTTRRNPSVKYGSPVRLARGADMGAAPIPSTNP